MGNSLGVVVLPKEVINRLHTGDGQLLFLIEAPDGYRLTPYDPSFEKKMAKAEDIIAATATRYMSLRSEGADSAKYIVPSAPPNA